MKSFAVAGAVLERNGSYLFVCNRRRDASLDWSPPGGVVDEGETVIAALRREVLEETNLLVDAFGSMLYSVEVDFEPIGWRLRAEIFRAASWSGELHVDDPDGVVIEAGFFDAAGLDEILAQSPQWVAEPFRAALLDNPERASSDDVEVPHWRYVATRRDSSHGGGFVVTAVT